ncbi:RagB/SusD family nutrient uptake outer membrane protein [Chitinophaga oryzae]|uniref:RagB/SusD family nutrient uptake outer membrane protein n=1 Tax=Chitinophaga oryzae TaxID=2725414 RepID=A0AAE6ZFY7_9BACT|nr:RagB/SusD family nutrient uptake outer membrane protein [Chitinophaga oryzae]QJB31896.1 RagB/SusD family nutrient uptake outer membrane protein [Chitinophaga oryzae]
MQHKASVHLLIFVLTMTATASCNKYLDVQPEDRLLEETVYSDRKSIRNALNGIYLNLAKPGLYGENLSSTTVDVMAQYFDVPAYTGRPFLQLSRYDYNDAGVREYMTTIWSDSYSAILNINIFIRQLESDSSIVSGEERRLMLGEAYGLRGLLAFDLLRLFGPVYQTDSTKAAIPYPVKPQSEVQPQLPATQVMANVLDDLTHAAAFLAKDPVRTQGANAGAPEGDAYFSWRNRRMNYFAVQGLLARALLYQGNTSNAKTIAAAVINEAGRWFPWSPADASAPGISNPDRVFSSEILFGLDNNHMYQTQQNWFAAINGPLQILIPAASRLDNIYESNPDDYRYRSWFAVDLTTNRIDKVFQKYRDVKDLSKAFRRLQPLLRMSEMYYIAAEGTPDDNEAAALLNTVRTNRGLPPLTLHGDKRDQLTLEYQKECWGEGQLFFYYKRINRQSIPRATGSGVIRMNSTKYVVPLPLSETTLR